MTNHSTQAQPTEVPTPYDALAIADARFKEASGDYPVVMSIYRAADGYFARYLLNRQPFEILIMRNDGSLP